MLLLDYKIYNYMYDLLCLSGLTLFAIDLTCGSEIKNKTKVNLSFSYEVQHTNEAGKTTLM